MSLVFLTFRYNPDAKQRVIRLVEAQVDPMEPPKHKHKKVPRGPPSPPVPVLHSPPRKLTVKDQQEWKIPPCISNWKNARGYTIPLDKRLAADGRGLQEVTINDKFAHLSESLYVAERKASEDLSARNKMRKLLAMREKEEKERELRDMAMRARMERAGVTAGLPADADGTKAAASKVSGNRQDTHSYYGPGSSGDTSGRRRDDSEERTDSMQDLDGSGRVESKAEAMARQEREKLRIERRKERERELRLENMKVRGLWTVLRNR